AETPVPPNALPVDSRRHWHYRMQDKMVVFNFNRERKGSIPMPDLTLSFAMTPYDRVMPLITGEVKPVGITLEYLGMPGGVPQVFFDQIKYHRYDLSEFSMSSFM